MVRVDIRKAWEVYELVGKYEVCDLFQITRLLQTSTFEFYLDSEAKICVIFQEISPEVVRIHAYVHPDKRGVEFLRALSTLESIVPYDTVMIDPDGDKRVVMLARLMKAKKNSDGTFTYTVRKEK